MNKYIFVSVHKFDARRGLKRCGIPGIGVSVVGFPMVNADFWRQADGTVLLRAVRVKEALSFAVRRSNGLPLSERQMEGFSWFVSEQLLRWVVDDDDEPFLELLDAEHDEAPPSWLTPPERSPAKAPSAAARYMPLHSGSSRKRSS